MRCTRLAFVLGVVGCGASAEAPGDGNGSSFSISIDVSGLSGTLVVRNNGTDQLSATTDGTFTFALPIADGGAYDVTVLNEPPSESCTVTSGSGTVHGGDVTVTIACAGDSFHIGGQLSNVTDTLVLRDNGTDDLSLTSDGSFVFATPLAFGASYAVTVKTQPATSSCSVSSGSGHVPAHDVTDVVVSCAPSYSIGVTVTGLAGSLTLEDNGADDLVIDADGTYTFATRLLTSATYAVTVATQPSGQVCTVTNGSSTVMTSDVSGIAVTCRNLALALNEIYARPASGALGDTNGDNVRSSTDDEFVEIINNEAVAVDLGGWVIRTGSGTPAVRYTFLAGTTLPAGGRAVVFGGGTPTGGFGGALTFASGGLSLTDSPAATFAVQLASAVAGITIDEFDYTSTTFGSSCTTTCASQVRSPEGTGAFVSHTVAAGAAILWSPGVAAAAAIPKLNSLASTPANAGTNVSIVGMPTAQFNMLMDATTFDNAHLRLYDSSCATLMNEVTAFSSIGAGTDNSKAVLVPLVPLDYATVYCLAIDATTSSVLDVPLGAAATVEFTTRPAANEPSASIVISEVGGCRQSSTSGPTACGGTGANDEFVELYNPTAAPVDISGWFVQRRSAGGTAACSATIPAATMLQSGQFYLIGGAGYTAANYLNAPAADLVAAGSLVVGTSESVVLISNAGTCTGSSNVIDAVSVGTITDSLATLELPAMPAIADGTSIERKACYNSTADTSTTGMLAGGGHETAGNSERLGANNADWIVRPTPNPQNAATSPAEAPVCP